jgi:hypothetical protein
MTTTTTMATGDDDNAVDGDSATGNKVDNDCDGATGDYNDDDGDGDSAMGSGATRYGDDNDGGVRRQQRRQ